MEALRRIEAYLKDPDFPLALKHVDSQNDLSFHRHDFHELIYVAGGRGIHLLGENRFILKESNIFLIPPGVEHGYEKTEELELYNVLFHRETMLPAVFDLESLTGYQLLFHIEPYLDGACSDRRQLFVEKERILDLLSLLEEQLAGEEAGWRYRSKHLFDRIIHTILTEYRPIPVNSPLDKLSRIMPYIQENLENCLSLEDLCREAGMSRSSLTRAFQQVYRMSPMEKVKERRIERAARLLREGDLSIQRIGELCGFSTSAYFSRTFREATGLTPSAYRRKPGPADYIDFSLRISDD